IGAWNRYAFDVSAFAGNQVYVAINYYVVDGGPNGTHSDNIWFDHLTLENPNYARLQVIHNAADPAAASVDVYVNDGLLLDDFAFRAATPFIDVPAGVTLNIGIAPGNSGSAADTLVNIPVVLAAGETYVAIANGVLNPANFEANPDGRSTAFQLLVNPAGQEASSNASTVEFSVLHGATDAPTVDVVARGVATLVDDAAYTDITPYIGVPAARYLLDITDATGSVTVATFEADLSGLAGGAAQVFASGFLTPANDQNGEPFGIFAALPDGNVVEFPAVTQARLQVIHNAADPAAASVDVYVNDGLLLDDFAFRAATPFIDVAAGVTLNIGIAPGSSGSAADTLVNIPVVLTAGETYVAIANGVLDPTGFAANPDGRSTAFQLLVNPAGQEASGVSNEVALSVVHGATDAPTVDVQARGVATLVDDAAYTDITPYFSVPASSYILDITDATGNTVVASFGVDLSGLGGGAATVLASGFLTPGNNQNGEAFGLIAVLPDGTVLPLDPVLSIATPLPGVVSDFALEQNYPNPFNPSTTIEYAIPRNERVTVTIYNIAGQVVARLLDRQQNAGRYQLTFDASNLSSGLYFYQIRAGQYQATKRMTLLK
nr:DUF4397 domain-containing protein [Calditrichia bacterium]